MLSLLRSNATECATLPPLPWEVGITLGPVGDGGIYYQAMQQHLALAFDSAHQLVLLPASLMFTDSCGHSCCCSAGSQHLHLALHLSRGIRRCLDTFKLCRGRGISEKTHMVV